MKKLEPYYNSMFNILFYIVVFIIFGIFMYAAIVFNRKTPLVTSTIRNIMVFRVCYSFIFHLSRNL